MDIVQKDDIKHVNPSKRPSGDYPYAHSAILFATKQLFLSSELLRPGKRSSAPHYHRESDEIVFVTMGELHACEGEECKMLASGDSICFHANSARQHFLENRSEADATFLLFRQNGAADDDVVY